VAIHSALGHLPAGDRRPEIFVLGDGLSADARRRLERVAGRVGAAKINWLELPVAAVDGLPMSRTGARASYGRLLVPGLLPADIARAVYLDADILVRHDISPLFEVDLGGATLGAVRDFTIGTMRQRWPDHADRLSSRAYFNSGVLAIDVASWRAANLTDQVLTYAAEQGPHLTFMDQDSLNAVAENWHELDLHWNVQQSLNVLETSPQTEFRDELLRERDELWEHAAVRHFVGLPKPWYHGSFLPGTMDWARAFLRTGWFNPVERVRWLAPWLAKRAVGRVLR
jgi:lipopolysaccharide biosynthesis glycosyltransferase